MLNFTSSLLNEEEKSKIEYIYFQYRNLMYSVAYKVLRNEHEAEDAVHQAFIKIAENTGKISDVTSPRTKSFAVTVVEHTAIDRYRKISRHSEADILHYESEAAIEYTGDDALADCILKLPVRYRHAIVLKYYNGYSTREIAEIMDISYSAAGKLEQRARNELEKLCKEAELL